ncbi:MAG: hypothetical protein ACR2J0_05995 [Mycobacteriales bacterium]
MREAALTALRVLVFLAGLAVVALTAASAVRTVVLPRAVPARLTRVVFLAVRGLYRLRLGRAAGYEQRDAVMASYAPVSLLVLLQMWLVLVWLGYAAMLWAAGAGSTAYDLVLSGSSLVTLGFVAPHTTVLILLAITEAAVGLVLLALLITYLPSLYGAFSRREAMVAKLAVRAGEPPSGAELLIRASVLSNLDALGEFFAGWEDWFIELEETHTSFPALTFFRSPQPDQSWVTAAGAVLDAASLRASTVDAPRDVTSELTIRAGYLALRRTPPSTGCHTRPTRRRPTRSPSAGTSTTRSVRRWRGRAWRCGPTARPRGRPSPVGGSTTTSSWYPWRHSPWRRTRPGPQTARCRGR